MHINYCIFLKISIEMLNFIYLLLQQKKSNSINPRNVVVPDTIAHRFVSQLTSCGLVVLCSFCDKDDEEKLVVVFYCSGIVWNV